MYNQVTTWQLRNTLFVYGMYNDINLKRHNKIHKYNKYNICYYVSNVITKQLCDLTQNIKYTNNVKHFACRSAEKSLRSSFYPENSFFFYHASQQEIY